MGSRGPKAGFKKAKAAQALALAAASAMAPGVDGAAVQPEKAAPPAAVKVRPSNPPAPAAQEIQVHKDPLQRSRDIKSMQGDELRAYARQLGIRPRDVAELSDDRLRQNCMLTVANLIEELTG